MLMYGQMLRVQCSARTTLVFMIGWSSEWKQAVCVIEGVSVIDEPECMISLSKTLGWLVRT